MLRPIALVTIQLAVVLAAFSGHAHEAGISHAVLVRGAGEWQLRLRFDAADWGQLEPSFPDGSLELEADGVPLVPQAPARVDASGEHVDLTLRYPAAAGSLRYAFTGFARLRHGHRQYVELRDVRGQRVADTLLREGAPSMRWEP